jgi:hypothetical protein
VVTAMVMGRCSSPPSTPFLPLVTSTTLTFASPNPTPFAAQVRRREPPSLLGWSCCGEGRRENGSCCGEGHRENIVGEEHVHARLAFAPPQSTATLPDYPRRPQPPAGKPQTALFFFLRPPARLPAWRREDDEAWPPDRHPRAAWANTAWPAMGPSFFFNFFPTATWKSLLGRSKTPPARPSDSRPFLFI